MITTLLASTYGLGCGGFVYNIARIKLLNDLDTEVRGLRDYDLSYEKIDPALLPMDCLILAKMNSKKE